MDKISISEGFSRWMKYLYPRKKRLLSLSLSLSLSPHAAAVGDAVEERAVEERAVDKVLMALSDVKFCCL